MLADVAGDGLLEVVDRAEHTALQSLLGQCSKEAFDGVDPGCRGRDEVEHHRGWRSSQARTLGCLWVA